MYRISPWHNRDRHWQQDLQGASDLPARRRPSCCVACSRLACNVCGTTMPVRKMEHCIHMAISENRALRPIEGHSGDFLGVVSFTVHFKLGIAWFRLRRHTLYYASCTRCEICRTIETSWHNTLNCCCIRTPDLLRGRLQQPADTVHGADCSVCNFQALLHFSAANTLSQATFPTRP